MRLWRPRSIRARLTALIGGISLGSLLIGFGAVLLRDVQTLRTATAEQAVLFARVVGEYAVGDLAFSDPDAGRESLAKLASVSDARAASLYDSSGILFATWGNEDSHLERVAPEAPASVARDGGILTVVEPVRWEGDRYGTIIVQISTARARQELRIGAAILGALLVVLTVLTLLAASRWQRAISEPILSLALEVRRISMTGNYSTRVADAARRDDEVGVLGRGIDDMLDQIERRERERDAAEHRTREKSQFLANMSHELRTPLNSIIGFSELLDKIAGEKLPARERRFLGNIQNSGRHLLAIINDILDLSKVEAGRMELQLEQIRVEELVASTVRLMTPIAEESRVSLVVDLAEDLPPVRADPVKAKQILYNLVSNAVKFSPEGGRVRIESRVLAPESSSLGESSIELAVEDRGIGIAPENHERIFDSFHQVDGSTSRQFGGTGLGLALVRTFCEMHGGSITVDSALGRGSRFVVLLPVRPPTFNGDTTAGGTPRSRILVVEDDPATCAELRRLLKREGHESLVAAHGDAALALARSAEPDAVILDLVLPGMTDGWDVLRDLKADPRTADVPILVFSRLENRELGLALGADDYFLKPFDLERMLARLEVLVQRPSDGPAGRSAAARPQRVLVVDDDASLVEVLAARLTENGYLVDRAFDRSRALELASDRPPDVVLLDLRMGDLDGLRLAYELRSLPATRRVPIVLLTGEDLTTEDSRRMRERVLDLVASEPEEGRDALIRVLQELLERRRRPARTL